MKLGIQANMLSADNLFDKIKLAEKYGFQGVEICYENDLIKKLDYIKDVFSISNVNLSVVSGFAGDLLENSREAKDKAIENYELRMKFCAELGGEGVISVPTFGQGVYSGSEFSVVYPGQSKVSRQDQNVLVKTYEVLEKLAEDFGVFLIIEPLNRYETCFIQKLEHASEICRLVGGDNIKLMADFYHMNIEEADISNSLLNASEFLAYVHLADSNRLLPGCGHIDFAKYFKTLKQIGYNQFLTLESAIKGDHKIELERFMKFIKNL